jgi:hypothetical protein
MAIKRPLCNYSGDLKELAAADSLVSIGLFEIDVDGGLMPVTDSRSDIYYELDVNGDIQPI